ncbi:MAG: TPM domain-containing protein [Bacillota bacterium]
MQQASTLFSEEQKQRIAQAVGQAESRTSAEIVPVVATASGRYDRAEDIVGLWVGLIAMSLVWLLLPKNPLETGNWGQRSLPMDWGMLIGTMVLGFIVGTALGSHVGWLRRLFTPIRQMREEVAERARQVFFDARVHHTTSRTGLLIYLSLYERTAVLLADQMILEKLGQPALDELCARLVTGLRSGKALEPLCDTIEEAGSKLAQVLPIAADDRNEIGNALVVID